MKRAFHPFTLPQRINPPSTQAEVESFDLPISQRTFVSTMQMVARQMGTRFAGDVIPLPESVQDDPTYPRGLKILYRKFPCGFLADEAGGNCISFDVIPLGVKGDPRRYRSYRSFMGAVEESEKLFAELVRFLRAIVTTVTRVTRTAALRKRSRGRVGLLPRGDSDSVRFRAPSARLAH